MPIAGTPFTLNYNSDRVPGRTTDRSVIIPLSGATPPTPLRRIELQVLIAGEMFTQSFTATANQTATFTWDGKDAYGRTVQGVQTATIRVGYVYGGVYFGVDEAGGSFGSVGTAPISLDIGRIEFTISQEETVQLGNNLNASSADALGGWTLDVHHSYDPAQQVLYLGNGDRVDAGNINHVISTVQGVPTPDDVFQPDSVATDPQGNVYVDIASRPGPGHVGGPVTRIAPDGTVTTIADGFGAFIGPIGMAIDSQGNIYETLNGGNVIGKISASDQQVTGFAGTASDGFSGDGGPATNAQLHGATSLAADSQGDVFVLDRLNFRIRKIDPNGIITTVAGNGTQGFSGDGGPAVAAEIDPAGIAIDRQGNLYIADGSNNRIRRVGPDGIITTIAGNGTPGETGDGGPAISAEIDLRPLVCCSFSMAVDSHGTVYFEERDFGIRAISSDGTITTVAGGRTSGGETDPPSGDGGPATATQLVFSGGGNSLAIDAAGSLLVATRVNGIIRRITNPFPGASLSDIFVPAQDGSQLYHFDVTGRHLQTLDTVTGATLFSFGYDSAGRLTSITDRDGNATTIERNANGDPMAIDSPFGQRTTFTLDSNGYLASITDPARGEDQYTYSPNGLMATFTDPVNNVHQFSYDTLGRLHQDQEPAPAGGSTTLDRTETANGFEVTVTKTMTATQNIVSTYLVEELPNGNEHRMIMTSGCCDGDQVIRPDGTQTITHADGTVENIVLGPDPRWGMQAPALTSDTTTTPSGLTSVLTEQRSATLANPTNPLSLTTLTDTLSLNGNAFVQTYDAASRTFTNVSPEGRREVITVDSLDRIVSDQVGNLEPLHVSYDTHGFITAIGQGSGATDRTWTFAPDSSENVASITSPSPLSLTTSFGYDPAGRPSNVTLPGSQQATQTYFADGNVQSVTPAGQPAHNFTYTSTGLLQTYTPPDIGTGPTTVTYGYNLDGQLNQITQPGGAQLSIGYDSFGRPQTITLPNGQYTYAYDPHTENLQSIMAPDNGVLAYTYDGFLRTGMTWTGTVHGQLTQTFDNNFNVASQSVDGGPAISFQYNHDGILTQAGDLTLTPDPNTGFVTSSTLGGVTTSTQPDPFGAVANTSASFNGTSLYSTQYTPDAEGRIHQLTETIGGTTNTFVYDYDLNGQLHQVTENGMVIATYGYDANGNRMSVTTATGTVTASVNAQDQLTQLGDITYTYAADGSLASRTSGNHTTNYSYDLLGNLTHVTLPDGTQIDYVIDGQGNRIGKRVNGTLVQGFLYDDHGRIVAELDGNNNVVSQFIYASSGATPDYMIRGGNTYRILTDRLGSPRLIVNVATGAVVQRMDYDAFGNIVQDTTPGFQPFGFAGGLYDQDTHLTRFGFRDYDAEAGRWTSKDPIGFFAGYNWYAYAANDPVNISDPTGLAPPDPFRAAKIANALRRLAAELARAARCQNAAERAAQRAAQRAAAEKASRLGRIGAEGMVEAAENPQTGTRLFIEQDAATVIQDITDFLSGLLLPGLFLPTGLLENRA